MRRPWSSRAAEILSSGRGSSGQVRREDGLPADGIVAEAKAQVLAVVDGLVEQPGDVIARIVAMVAEAWQTKARTQLFIEKVEQRYSAGMVTATVLLFVVPLLAGGAFQPALLRAMTFIIVASPCDAGLAVPPAAEFMALPGRGVSAVVNGQRIEIGSPRHLPGAPGRTAAGIGVTGSIAALAAGAVADLEADGQTAVVMHIDGDPVAVLGVADRIRPVTVATVMRITALTSASPVLLTGDNERAPASSRGRLGSPTCGPGCCPRTRSRPCGSLRRPGERCCWRATGSTTLPPLPPRPPAPP
jgi:cation transport ATPase